MSKKVSDVPKEVRDQVIVDLRYQGYTLREIGHEVDLTPGAVRNVLSRLDVPNDAGADKRTNHIAIQHEQVEQWIHENYPVTKQDVMSHFDISETRYNHLVGRGLSVRVIRTHKEWDDKFSDDDIFDAMRRASALLGESKGLSQAKYDEVREKDDPSSQTIIARIGWNRACEQSGVKPGRVQNREYEPRWTLDESKRIIKEFVDDCKEGEVHPTIEVYERRAKGREDIPSFTTIRNVFKRETGNSKWIEIIRESTSVSTIAQESFS